MCSAGRPPGHVECGVGAAAAGGAPPPSPVHTVLLLLLLAVTIYSVTVLSLLYDCDRVTAPHTPTPFTDVHERHPLRKTRGAVGGGGGGGQVGPGARGANLLEAGAARPGTDALPPSQLRKFSIYTRRRPLTDVLSPKTKTKRFFLLANALRDDLSLY
ncbi:hypothetical protein NQ318_015131, partial [Aromia moschata]